MKRFLTRSADRETDADLERIDPIRRTISSALQSLESEQDGFRKRIAETTMRAALIAGNDMDNQADREPADTLILKDYDEQIRRAEARLNKLNDLISHLKFIRAAVVTRLGE